MKTNKSIKASCLLAAMFAGFAGAANAETTLPDPDGKPADMTKPVKVFIVMGQSNTLEMGKVQGDADGALEKAVKGENLYGFLVDDAGKWTVRQDVRNVSVMQKGDNMNVYRNDWLTVSGNKIGIEIGIGHHLGNAVAEPVMILKSSIGNRGLGWDLLPPGSESYEFTGIDNKTKQETTWVYPGYKQSPNRWVKGTEPVPIGWYAGKQYDDDTANAKKVLAEIGKYYPEATKYEIAGFLWWQGDKDRYDEAHASRYEKNLVNLINALRKDFNAPNAPFVLGTLGQSEKGAATGNDKLILEAQLAVDGESGKYPEFKGNVSTVYTHPLSMGGASNGHYNGNAKTYMNVGLGLGEAMTKLLK
jgi:Carbohydrate esterase, sialic acid-specific acetylesterase